ncbi:hypothetical protein DPEC_G00194460 [Dallia pectoralis]|uniref:Uncharacterized protein n=1 Tax=Dallia pectoralis TaxID=75939 RepID=A0ACC2G7K8_DALPE|nr:hypothetical protein DPEC_G00194460 [Dallia pectoralis]
MPPKKTATTEEVSESSNATKKDENMSTKAKSESSKTPAVVRKPTPHPPTMVMIKEALKELDSRKGVSLQAIRGYITEKYPSVDLIRLKYMIRKALSKGLEGGVLVRPANSTATGAQGRFRLAVKGKAKESKVKTTENTNPNLEKTPRSPKAGPKTKATDVVKKKPAAKKQEQKKPSEDAKPKAANEVSASKVPPAKKPKAKKPAEGVVEDQPKLKAAKTTKASKGVAKGAGASKGTAKVEGPAKKKGAKAKVSLKLAEGDDGDIAPPKTTGRRGKKAAAAAE